MISHLGYDEVTNALHFDITFNHFREIYKYDLNDSTISHIKNNNLIDERNMVVSAISGIQGIFSR